MSDYPDSVYTPRTIANREGVVYDSSKTKVFYAEDLNNSNAEIVAVQEILGLNPEGTFTSVVDRLDDIDDQLDDLAVTDGWKPSSVQPTLIDSDDPNFTLRFTGDVTGILSKGMRLKFTQNSAVVYFIIVAVGAYSGTNTDVMVYGGTDYNVLNTSTYPISLCKYSGEKAPFGFPLNPDLWTVELKDTASDVQFDPVSGTWYNLGSISITIPAGAWHVSYNVNLLVERVVGYFARVYATLSTANNSQSDSEMTTMIHLSSDSQASDRRFAVNVFKDKYIELTTEDVFYLNAMTDVVDTYVIGFLNGTSPLIIRAVCAYL